MDFVALQARLTARGLQNFPFGACFSSPICRARQCAELIWEGRQKPIQYLPDLSEAYLGWLQGMKNDYAAEHYADVYGARACLCMYISAGLLCMLICSRPISYIFDAVSFGVSVKSGLFYFDVLSPEIRPIGSVWCRGLEGETRRV